MEQSDTNIFVTITKMLFGIFILNMILIVPGVIFLSEDVLLSLIFPFWPALFFVSGVYFIVFRNQLSGQFSNSTRATIVGILFALGGGLLWYAPMLD